MQEVQSQWNTYQENHEIEQIWYSSRRISDKMQVRERGISWIETDDITTYVIRDDYTDPNSEYVLSTYTIAETIWDTDYRITSEWIQMPFYWWYHITWYIVWWASIACMRLQIRVNGKAVAEYDNTSVYDKTLIDITLNLWKYDIISTYARVEYYTGSGTHIEWNLHSQLNITKI